MDAIFTRGWIYLGHASEIPQPGDYKLSWMGRASVILTRDESGQVQAMFNRCRHRAATVCQAGTRISSAAPITAGPTTTAAR